MIQTSVVSNQPIITIGSSLYEKILFEFSSSSVKINQTNEAMKIESDDGGWHQIMIDDSKKHRLSEVSFASMVTEKADKNKDKILPHIKYGDDISHYANGSSCKNMNSIINAMQCYRHKSMSNHNHEQPWESMNELKKKNAEKSHADEFCCCDTNIYNDEIMFDNLLQISSLISSFFDDTSNPLEPNPL